MLCSDMICLFVTEMSVCYDVTTVDGNVSQSYMCGIASYMFALQHTTGGLVDVKCSKARMEAWRYIYSKKNSHI
jgi:hypothetical protein